MCAPSRASILTGRIQGECSLRDNCFDQAFSETNTLGTVMRAAGYATWAVGKWGVAGGGESGQPVSSHPLDRGFDYFYGFLDHMAGHTYYHYEGRIRGAFMGITENRTNATASAEGIYSTDLFAAKAKELVSAHVAREPERPFFLYLAVNAVHGSGQSGDNLLDKTPLHVPGRPYPDEGVVWPLQPEPLEKRNTWINPSYTNLPQSAARYATAITRMDDAIGDIMRHLERHGIHRDTLIVFTSDNGPADEYGADPRFFGSNGPFDGLKRDVDEAQKLIDEGASLSSLAEGLKVRRQYSDQFVEGAKAAAAELRDRVTLDGAQSAKVNDAALKAAEGNVEIAAKVAALAKAQLTNKHTQVDDAYGLESLVADAMRPFAPEARAVKIHDMRGNRNVGEQLKALEELGIATVEDAELNGVVRRDENGHLTGGARQAVNIAAHGTDALRSAVKDGSIDAATAEALITVSHTELGAEFPYPAGLAYLHIVNPQVLGQTAKIIVPANGGLGVGGKAITQSTTSVSPNLSNAEGYVFQNDIELGADAAVNGTATWNGSHVLAGNITGDGGPRLTGYTHRLKMKGQVVGRGATVGQRGCRLDFYHKAGSGPSVLTGTVSLAGEKDVNYCGASFFYCPEVPGEHPFSIGTVDANDADWVEGLTYAGRRGATLSTCSNNTYNVGSLTGAGVHLRAAIPPDGGVWNAANDVEKFGPANFVFGQINGSAGMNIYVSSNVSVTVTNIAKKAAFHYEVMTNGVNEAVLDIEGTVAEGTTITATDIAMLPARIKGFTGKTITLTDMAEGQTYPVVFDFDQKSGIPIGGCDGSGTLAGAPTSGTINLSFAGTPKVGTWGILRFDSAPADQFANWTISAPSEYRLQGGKRFVIKVTKDNTKGFTVSASQLGICLLVR